MKGVLGADLAKVANDCESILSTLEGISRAHSWEILMRKIKESRQEY